MKNLSLLLFRLLEGAVQYILKKKKIYQNIRPLVDYVINSVITIHWLTLVPEPHITSLQPKSINSVKNSHSPAVSIPSGVPRSSVIRPNFFIIFLLSVSHLFCKYNMHFHCSADNTQLYVSTEDLDLFLDGTLPFQTSVKSA